MKENFLNKQVMMSPKGSSFGIHVMLITVVVWFLGACIALAEQPNVIVILSDDQGYSTIGAYGGEAGRIVTPNLDRMCAEGARFTDAYVTANTCAPSRAGIVTGRYQQRFGYYANCDSHKPYGLPASEKTFARYFKDAGYATAMIGKWHLRVGEGQHPLDRGFDEYFGFDHAQTSYLKSNILYRNRKKVKEHKYLTDAFTDEAVDFIRRKKDGPFFVYLAYNALHGPNQVTPEHMEPYKGRFPEKEVVQCGMIAALDKGVGRVFQTLEELGLDDDTLVIYLGDNGGIPGFYEGSNAPMRSFKRTHFEGGLRVPFIVRWPGKVKAGQVRQEPVISIDVMPTILAAATIEPPAGAGLDGINLLPYLTRTKPMPERALFWAGGDVSRSPDAQYPPGFKQSNPPPGWAIRRGPWKLVHTSESGRPELYNLEKDVGEATDVISQHPEIAERLKMEWRSWMKDMGSPMVWKPEYYEQLKAVE